MNRPIVILGLGRSGTTWISDIISKYSGGIILFEPLHPATYPSIEHYLYKDDFDLKSITPHVNRVVNKEIRNPWLLRNHLNSETSQVDSLFLEDLWERAQIIGFKTIRLNTAFIKLIDHYNAKLVFVIRHPLAVISSIRNRPNFWEDLGWEKHWKLLNDAIEEEQFKKIIKVCKSDIEKLAFYWGYVNSKSLHQLNSLKINPIFYEDLYLKPFTEVEKLLNSLSLFSHQIHPAHLFTPSMMTLKTVHQRRFAQIHEHPNSLDFFWKETLNSREINKINNIISKLCDCDDRLSQMCSDRDYLYDS